MQSISHIRQNGIEFKAFNPMPALVDFVEGIWMLENTTDKAHPIVIMPNGRFDMLFFCSSDEPNHPILRGLETKPEQNFIPPKTILFIISFKLLAIEYLLSIKAAPFLNNTHALPNCFWSITKTDLNDFKKFCEKVSAKMLSLIKPGIDSRKQKLFDLIYSSNGCLTVKKLSEKVFWNSRQINRYFNKYFGISLKAYCNILRFTDSLQHIKTGKLSPALNFTDQNHLIKEVKKFSGVVPGEIFKNKNDRFLLFHPMLKK